MIPGPSFVSIAAKGLNNMIGRILKRILFICMLPILFCGLANAVDCEKVFEEYNDCIRLYHFKEALDILNVCSTNCIQQENICSLQAIVLKATIRNYIDVQLKIAREAKEENPGAAVRSYKRIMEIAKAYSEKSEGAVAEAENSLPGLQKEVDRAIGALVKNGERALADFRFDRVRDIIYELYLLDYGSAQAQELAQKAAEKIEDFIKNQRFEIERLVTNLNREVTESSKSPSVRNKERLKKIDQITKALNTKIDASLSVKPGDEGINRLYDRAKSTKDQAAKRGVSIALLEPDKQLTETTREVLRKAIEEINRGKYGEAVRKLKHCVSASGFNKDEFCSAYIYLGIAYAAQVNPKTANSMEDKLLRVSAMRSFRKALSFNPQVQIPKDFNKYRNLLEESRHLESPRKDPVEVL